MVFSDEKWMVKGQKLVLLSLLISRKTNKGFLKCMNTSIAY